MTFGSMLRAYGRLANISSRLSGEERKGFEVQMNAEAEKLLLRLLAQVFGGIRKDNVVEPRVRFTNVTYDSGSRGKG